MTNIPFRESSGEKRKSLNLHDVLKRRVKGAGWAVELVADAIIRAKSWHQISAGQSVPSCFLGPTGVGKTEVARSLAEALFDSEDRIIRIDMSEYMEKFAVSRLIGAPPGYVGYEEGGQLTEKVRRSPYSIVLFDEIEKAHPDVFNLLLQILDDGRLTDSQGRVVDFKNTIIIMTSNLGSKFLLRNENKSLVENLVKQTFKPEFINRIDEIVIFNPLSKEVQFQIVDKILGELAERLKEQHYRVNFSEAAKRKILDESYSHEYGARAMKRYIQKKSKHCLRKQSSMKPCNPIVIISSIANTVNSSLFNSGGIFPIYVV